jgi:dihydroneopterin aldolase
LAQTADTGPGTALITGAGRRIGKAIALDLARHGWRIGVHYASSQLEAEGVVAEIRATGAAAVALGADLADAAAAAALVPRCATALGTPTLLVNSAALFLGDEVDSLDPAQWDRQLAVNLRAPVLLAKAFAEALPSDRRGDIINIVDQRVWRLTPDYFSYTIAKAGLYTATQTLAQSLAPRIRVNAIGPGPVLANIHQTPAEFAEEVAGTLLERATPPAEIAAAVHFILAAPSMTGQMIALDAGQHLVWTPSHGAPAQTGSPKSTAQAPPAAVAEDKPLRRVFVRDLELMASVGVFEMEKRYEQRLVVSLDLWVIDDYDGRSDALSAVLDYGAVVANVRAIVETGHTNLIETLAERIATAALADPRVVRTMVRLEKPDIVPGCRSVGIEITRGR